MNWLRRGGGVFAPHFEEFALDDFEEAALVFEDFVQLGDEFDEFEVLGFDFVALQTGELVEAHIENGIGLAIAQGILGHEALLGLASRFFNCRG